MMNTNLTLFLLLTSTLLTAQTPQLVIPIGHTDAINDMAFSPTDGGKIILTGSNDGTAKLWDRNGHEIITFRGHTEGVEAVAFSPDGKYILTGGGDKTIKLWDLSGREIHTFRGHTGGLKVLVFSPACPDDPIGGKYILSGSWDSTAIVWDRASGQRLQTTKRHTSGITAVAFSPDGKYILTGSGRKAEKQEVMKGKTNLGIATLFDREGGQEIWSFNGHTSEVKAVAFSPDGKYVLTGSGDKTAKLLDQASGKAVQTFEGPGTFSYVSTLAFSPDGNYILYGGRGHAQIWDRKANKLLRSVAIKDSGTAEAFSPPSSGDPIGGQYLLVGYGFHINLLDWTGKETQGFTGHSMGVSSLAYSTNGESLLMGGSEGAVKHWDLPKMKVQTLSGHDDRVLALAFVGNTKWIRSAGADNLVIQWDEQGQLQEEMEGGNNSVLALALSPSDPDDPAGGKYVLYGLQSDKIELWDRVAGKKLWSMKPGDGAGSSQQEKDKAQQNEFPLTNSGRNDMMKAVVMKPRVEGVSAVAFSPNDGGKYILSGDLNHRLQRWDRDSGQKINSYTGHTSAITAVAFSPDGQFVLSGSEDGLAKLWSVDGTLLHTFSGHTSAVHLVAFSPDGQYLLTTSADHSSKLWSRASGKLIQTFQGHTADAVVFSPPSPTDPAGGKYLLTGGADNKTKFWDTQSGAELATLIGIDSTDWVVTAPNGLFDASPGAMRLMHFVVGLEVIELEQLKERYYEPGLLQKVLGFIPGELRDVSALSAIALYPEVQAVVEGQQLKINLKARSGGLGKLSFFINSKEVAEDLNPDRAPNVSIELKAYNKFFQLGANILAIRVYNSDNWLKSPAYELNYTPPATTGSPLMLGKTKPHLYAIVIGTSDYSGNLLDLRFPDLDATAIAQALQAAGSRLFEDRVHLRLLTTGAKTEAEISSKTNIAAAFSAYAEQAKPADLLVVYFSGHGVTYGGAEKSQFYYLTKDIASTDLKDPDIRNNYAVSSEDLTAWLTANPAQKQVMIVDACNSGKVVESLAAIGARDFNASQIRALDRMKDRTGMFILTGAAADKVSFEASQYGQGLLTYSLLQGMSGLALTPDKRVDVMTLFQYARDEVPVLAKGIRQVQVPVLAFPAGGGSFDIGIVDDQVHIPLVQAKPVFIRNVFQDEDTFDDALGLGKALAGYFEQVTARGAQAELIYVDVSEYKNAYSIKGRYTVSGDVVKLRGRLFQGRETKGEFELEGETTALPALVKAIVEKVSGMM